MEQFLLPCTYSIRFHETDSSIVSKYQYDLLQYVPGTNKQTNKREKNAPLKPILVHCAMSLFSSVEDETRLSKS
jgi:hypothetical protein